MKWYKVEVKWEDELSKHDLRDIGRWVHLLNYCTARDNGGIIEGARGWSQTQWDRLVHTRIRDDVPGLYSWRDDGALVLDIYPHASEQMNAQRVDLNRARAETRWGKKREKGTEKGTEKEKTPSRKMEAMRAEDIADEATVQAFFADLRGKHLQQ